MFSPKPPVKEKKYNTGVEKLTANFPAAPNTLSIDKKPHKKLRNICIWVQVIGEIQGQRSPERKHLKSKLREFTPMHLHTKKLTVAGEEKIMVGNMNDTKFLAVLQRISSEKNLENRLNNNAYLECLEIQPCNLD